MRVLREQREHLTINKFNALDRRIDQLVMASAEEPYVDHTLRPLHTMFRRIGWLYHSKIAGGQNLQRSIDCHVALLDAVANRHIGEAIAASDELIAFVDTMFDVLEHEIDRRCSTAALLILPQLIRPLHRSNSARYQPMRIVFTERTPRRLTTTSSVSLAGRHKSRCYRTF